MAIVSVKESPIGRGGVSSVGKNRYTRCFLVVTNSPYDGPYEAMAAAGIPGPGSIHPSHPYAFATHAKADPEGKGKLAWIVSVDYTTERQRSENPFSDPASIEWSTDTTQEPFSYDKDGYAILNSAGDRFTEQIKEDVSRWVVVITTNLPFVPSWINTYRDAVNSDAVYIDGIPIAAGMAKIKSIRISKWQTRGVYRFRELQLAIKIKDDWLHRVVDNGLRQVWVVGGETLRLHVYNDDGTPSTVPQLLDGEGGQLIPPTPATAHILTFDLRNTKPFYVLPLS